ncbi:MAG TPA: DUF4349 domain-containing protein [Caulobacteraceae bacterium]|jgi:hypothetical protein
MRRWIPLLLFLGVAACQKPALRYQKYSDEAAKVNLLRAPPVTLDAIKQAPAAADAEPAAAAEAPDASAEDSAKAVGAAAQKIAPPPVGAVPQLAYSYDYALTVPARRLADLEHQHERACQSAGPAICQILGSDMNKSGDDVTGAHLLLRAAPAWISRFRQSVDGQTRGAGGSVTSSKVESEDLSRSIVDSEAAVRARTTLRDRLQKLLAERPGKLSDVIEAERELAKVQGELDASQSELAVMRARIDMSDLTLEYISTEVIAPGGGGRPLQQAFATFFSNMVGMFSLIVTFFSFALPVLVVFIPIAWLAWRYRPRRKLKPAPKSE